MYQEEGDCVHKAVPLILNCQSGCSHTQIEVIWPVVVRFSQISVDISAYRTSYISLSFFLFSFLC